MFVIAIYPYGRKHPPMYLCRVLLSSTQWTFNKDKAIKFEKKKQAKLIANLEDVKGVVKNADT